MKVFEIIERLEIIIKFLEEKNTGTSIEFAKRIGISRSMLFNYFDYLKSFNINIKYDRQLNSFVINGNTEVEIQQPIKIYKL